MKRRLALVVCAACVGAGPVPALAHAFLDHAMPAVGSTVGTPPESVILRFTTPLEPSFSRLRVLDQSNRQVDRSDATVDPRDTSSLRVSLPKLPPGRYRVVWRVLSVDTHVTEGDFTFDVAQ